MTLWQRITREPAAILGVITAGAGLAVLFGLDLSTEQTAGITAFAGVLMVLIRQIVTPASEVAAQLKPGASLPVAGPAATVTDGAPVTVQGV